MPGATTQLLKKMEAMVCRQEAKVAAWRTLFASLEGGYSTVILDASGLSHREEQVAKLSIEGHRPLDIARILGISPRTVETHLRNIRRKQRETRS